MNNHVSERHNFEATQGEITDDDFKQLEAQYAVDTQEDTTTTNLILSASGCKNWQERLFAMRDSRYKRLVTGSNDPLWLINLMCNMIRLLDIRIEMWYFDYHAGCLETSIYKGISSVLQQPSLRSVWLPDSCVYDALFHPGALPVLNYQWQDLFVTYRHGGYISHCIPNIANQCMALQNLECQQAHLTSSLPLLLRTMPHLIKVKICLFNDGPNAQEDTWETLLKEGQRIQDLTIMGLSIAYAQGLNQVLLSEMHNVTSVHLIHATDALLLIPALCINTTLKSLRISKTETTHVLCLLQLLNEGSSLTELHLGSFRDLVAVLILHWPQSLQYLVFDSPPLTTQEEYTDFGKAKEDFCNALRKNRTSLLSVRFFMHWRQPLFDPYVENTYDDPWISAVLERNRFEVRSWMRIACTISFARVTLDKLYFMRSILPLLPHIVALTLK